jgi:hypothetical protein
MKQDNKRKYVQDSQKPAETAKKPAPQQPKKPKK